MRTDPRPSLIFPVLGAMIALALVLPVVAVAAPADDVWTGVQVTLVQGSKGVPTMLILGQLSSTVTLPAEVALSVPSGRTVTWAGEVFPTGGGTDTKVAYRVEKNAAPGWDRVVLKLTKSRDAQVEVAVPGAFVTQGGDRLATVTWRPLGGIGRVQMAIGMPAGSKVVTGTPGGGVVQGDSGPAYAVASPAAVRAGVSLSLSVLYSPGAGVPAGSAAAAPAPAPGSSGPATGPLLAVVVVLILVLGYLVVSRHIAASGPNDEDAEDTPRDRG